MEKEPDIRSDRAPLYMKTFDEAYSLGETDKYHADHELNVKCRQAIKTAIADNYDGYHLKHDISDAVIQQYGLQRVVYVLANSIQLMDYDGRVSADNKAWAKGYSIKDDERNRRYYFVDSAGLVNIFAKEVRNTEALLNQVADNVIDIGRHATTSGNYFVNFEKAGKDILSAEQVALFKEDIASLMYGSEAVLDLELSDEGEFDVVFGLSFCPNYEPHPSEVDEHGEDWPVQETPAPLSKAKPSVIAQLQDGIKATKQSAETEKTAPKRSTEREV